MLREIKANEVDKLIPLINDINVYHNKVSTNFKGTYPRHTQEEKLNGFKDDLLSGTSKMAVIEEDNEFLGVIKIDIDVNKSYGLLDFFVVSSNCRGKGYGKELIEWALNSFKEKNIKSIEVLTIDGNPAVEFYQKFGFKMQAYVLEIRND